VVINLKEIMNLFFKIVLIEIREIGFQPVGKMKGIIIRVTMNILRKKVFKLLIIFKLNNKSKFKR
jgi:hypothetical protein